MAGGDVEEVVEAAVARGTTDAARQALPPSVRMFRLHVKPAGQTELAWLPTGELKSVASPYSNDFAAILYGPKTSTSTPILPWLSSIQ